MKPHSLSDHIAHEAVTNVIKLIHVQLELLIKHHVSFNPDNLEYMLKPLDRPLGWMLQEPYISLEFEIMHEKFGFLRLCNYMEMLHGIDIAYEFDAQLVWQLRIMVEKAVGEESELKEEADCANTPENLLEMLSWQM